MRRWLFAAVLGAIVFGLVLQSSSFAAATGTLTSSSITVTNNLGQAETHLYDVYVPSNVRKPAKALFVVHGCCQTRVAVEGNVVGALSLADKYGIVAVFPEFANGQANWSNPILSNCGKGCRSDVPFFVGLRSRLVSSGLIDGTQVYVLGGSQGVAQTLELMCDPASSAGFRGYGLVTGTIPVQAGFAAPICPASNRNYLFYASAGTNDPAIPYNGSTSASRSLLSQQAMLDFVALRLGCSGRSTSYDTTATLRSDTYTKCPSGRSAGLLSVIGGTHYWGGLHISPAFYQATPATWNFWNHIQAAAPDFSLTAAPGSQTVTAGKSASSTVSVSPVNGFSGAVKLTVSGLPAKATATFTPATVAAGGSATLSIATAAATPAGSYTLTITGTSGSLTHTTTATLNVQTAGAANFALAATPSAKTVKRTFGAEYVVSLTAINGFAGAVTISASSLPPSTTLAISGNPATASNPATVKVRTTSSTPLGTFPITIHGTAGTLSHSITVTVTVT